MNDQTYEIHVPTGEPYAVSIGRGALVVRRRR